MMLRFSISGILHMLIIINIIKVSLILDTYIVELHVSKFGDQNQERVSAFWDACKYVYWVTIRVSNIYVCNWKNVNQKKSMSTLLQKSTLDCSCQIVCNQIWLITGTDSFCWWAGTWFAFEWNDSTCRIVELSRILAE